MTFAASIPRSRYDFPNDFIDRICARHLSDINPEASAYIWDKVYDACRVYGPREAVREARWYADFYAE
jgi:hypothetical protein